MMEQLRGIRLEQLWYTWSTEGLGGVVGLQIRAASEGLMDINSSRVRSFRTYLDYYLPQGTDSYTAKTENSPICLTFADPAAGTQKVASDQRKDSHAAKQKNPRDSSNQATTHILVRKVYKGKDNYGRAGVYFAHLIDLQTERPLDFVASDAIELWNAPLWKESDDIPGRVRLDPIEGEKLKPDHTPQYPLEGLRAFKAQELEFIIQAFLSLKPEQKLYIAAPAEQVALLIWGLTHSLPRSLQQAQHLTFSTYEQDVTRAAARVVGTCRPDATAARQLAQPRPLLPAECFRSNASALALDCYTGQRSPLEQNTDLAEYARFAVQQLVSGNKRTLDNLLNSANKGNVANIQQLSITFKAYSNALKDLTPENATGLLENSELAAGLLMEPVVQQAIINLCVTHPSWWKTKGQSAIRNLRLFDSPPGIKDAVTQLSKYTAEILATFLLENDEKNVTAMLEFLSVAAPEEEKVPWVHLLLRLAELSSHEKDFSPRKAFSCEMRFWLLLRWAPAEGLINEEIRRRNYDLIRPWLQVSSWSELAKLLELREQLPALWRQIAIADAILRFASSGHFPKPEFIRQVMKVHRALFERALESLMLQPATRYAALGYFTFLVNAGYDKCFDLLVSLLTISSQIPNQDVEAFLRAIQITRFKQRQELLEKHPRMLLTQKITPSIISLIWQYLDRLEKSFPEKLGEANVKYILLVLYEHTSKFPGELANEVSRWYFLSTAVPPKKVQTNDDLKLNLESQYLRGIGEAVQHFDLQKDEAFKEGFYWLLVKNIRSSEKLREVVEVLAPAFSLLPMLMLRQLVIYFGEVYNPKTNSYGWLMPYLEQALRYSQRLQPPKDEKFLDSSLPPLLQNIDKDTFEQMDAAIQSWVEKDLQHLWNQYKDKVRPGKGFKIPFFPQKSTRQPLESEKAPMQAVGQQLAPSHPARESSTDYPTEAIPSNSQSYNIQDYDQQASPVPYQPEPSDPLNQNTITASALSYRWIQQPQGRQLEPPTSERETDLSHLHKDQGNREDRQENQHAQGGSGLEKRDRTSKDRINDKFYISRRRDHEQRLHFQTQTPLQTAGLWQQRLPALTEEKVRKIDALKFLYIDWWQRELSNRVANLRSQSEQLKQSLNDELDEIRKHRKGSEDNYMSTRRMLENDSIIISALDRYSDVQPYHDELFDKVPAISGLRGYKEVIQQGYTDDDIREMLDIFIRYRVMDKCLREQNLPWDMKEWLREERKRFGLLDFD